VPPQIVELIKRLRLFGYAANPQMAGKPA